MARTLGTLAALFALWVGGAQGARGQAVTASVQDSVVSGRDARPVTVPVHVTNVGDDTLPLRDRVVAPQGWQVLPDLGYELGPGEALTRLVTVVVPPGAPAGPYPVRVDVVGGGASAQFTVDVQAVYDVRLVPGPAPRYAVAGEPYESRFFLENGGNAEATVLVSAEGDGTTEVLVGRDTVRVPPGSRQAVAVISTHPSSQLGVVESPLRVAATVRDAAGAATAGRALRATATTVVLPRLARRGLQYHTYPVVLGASGGGVSQSGLRALTPAVQFFGRGRGTLRQGSQTVLAFDVLSPYLGPDTRRLGYRYDFYQVSLENPRFHVLAGDGPYRASQFASAYGFGGSAYVRPSRFGVGAFFSENRLSPLDDTKYGGEADVYVGPYPSRLGVNVLRAEGDAYPDATYAGVEGVYSPAQASQIAAEVGVSRSDAEETGVSGAVSGRGRIGRTTLSGYFRSRARGFPGRRGDVVNGGGSLRFPVSDAVRAYASGSHVSQAFETGGGGANTFAYSDAEAGVVAGATTLGGRVSDRRSRFGAFPQQRSEAVAQAATRLRARRLTVTLRAEGGAARSTLGDSSRVNAVGSAGASATYSAPRFDISAGTDFEHGRGLASPSVPVTETYSAFGTATLRPFPTVSLTATANASVTSGAFDSAFQSYRAAATWTLPWGHQLEAAGEYSRFSFGDLDFDGVATALVTYSAPIAVPVHRDRMTGAVAGRLTGGDGAGVAGVTVILERDGDIYGGGVTGPDGRFTLSRVPPGRYSLTTEPSADRPGAVLAGGAAEVVVEGGVESAVGLELTRLGRLTVAVVALAVEDDGPRTGRAGESGPVSGVVVKLTGEEVYYGFSNSSGEVVFGAVQPGTYRVELGGRQSESYSEAAPAESRTVRVDPGAATSFPLEVRLKRRPVRLNGPPIDLSAPPRDNRD